MCKYNTTPRGLGPVCLVESSSSTLKLDMVVAHCKFHSRLFGCVFLGGGVKTRRAHTRAHNFLSTDFHPKRLENGGNPLFVGPTARAFHVKLPHVGSTYVFPKKPLGAKQALKNILKFNPSPKLPLEIFEYVALKGSYHLFCLRDRGWSNLQRHGWINLLNSCSCKLSKFCISRQGTFSIQS